jgi:DNA-directed RNA polymerase beta' subunit
MSQKINLTESQIEEICNEIPMNQTIPEYIAKTTVNRIRTRLANDLSTITLYPEMFPKFKTEIIKHYYKTLAESGLAVGIQASTSLGERQTQSTLNSLDWEEKVLVYDRKNKKTIVEPIGQYIDRFLDDEKNKKFIQHIPENRTEYLELTDTDIVMPSVDEKGFTSWLKVEAVTRHLPVGQLVKVITQNGREVSATQAKSFLVWDFEEKKFLGKNGSDVKVGDYLPTSCHLDRVMEETLLPLEQFFPKTEYLYTTDLNKAKRLREKQPGNWWKEYVGKEYILPYSRPDAVFDKRREEFKNIPDGLVYLYKSAKFVSYIPDHIPLDSDFGFLVGIYLAEGWCTKTFTGISNKCPVIRKRVTDWCDRYGITYHLVETKAKQACINPEAVSVDLKLHSVLLTRLLTLMCNTGSDKKIVPICAYTANKEFQWGLIDGYFSGDGSVNKDDGSITASSVSKDLITGISFILCYFDIFGRFSSQHRLENAVGKNNKRIHNIRIANGFAQTFAKLGLTKPDKNEKLQNITLKKEYRYDKNKEQDSFEEYLIDVIFDRVVSIEFVEPTKVNVYDFTIAETRNFSTWNCLQNSDTFHSAGLSVKTVVVGVPRFSELLNATKSPKMVNCLIYLNDSFGDIAEIRNGVGNMLTDITFKRLVKSSELIKDEPLENWHHIFCDIYDILPSTLGWRFRFEIDISILYEYKVTMKMIAESITSEYRDSKVLYTPDWKGILDVFVDESCFNDINQIVQDEILEEEEEEEEEEEDQEEDEDEEEEEEKTIKKVEKSVKKVDFKGGKEDIIPQDINRIIHMEDKILPALLSIRICGIPNIKDIFFEKRKEEWLITTEGSNLYGLFSNPIIDKTKTMCNNMWEIYTIFGIEAARQFLIEEYMDVVSSDGSFVNSSNVELLVDVMVYTGTIISISRYGQKKVGCGPMAKASFEESLENFLKAGINGEKETTDGVSASIMLGKMPKTGTGVFELMADIPKILNTKPVDKKVVIVEERVDKEKLKKIEKLDMEPVKKVVEREDKEIKKVVERQDKEIKKVVEREVEKVIEPVEKPKPSKFVKKNPFFQ